MRDDEIVTKAFLKLFSFKKLLIRRRISLFREKISLFLDREKAERDCNFQKKAECQAKIDILMHRISSIDFVIRLIDSFDASIKAHQYTLAFFSLTKLILILQDTSLKQADLLNLLKMIHSYLEKISSVAYA